MIDPRGRRVTCPTCAAAPGHPCHQDGRPIPCHHPARTIAGHEITGRGVRHTFTGAERDLFRRMTTGPGVRIAPGDIALALGVNRATVYRAIRADDN